MNRNLQVQLESAHGAAVKIQRADKFAELMSGIPVVIAAGAYEITAADNGHTLIFNSATLQTVTIGDTLDYGFKVRCIRLGVGRVTFVNKLAGTFTTPNNYVYLRRYGLAELEVLSNADGLTSVTELSGGLEPAVMLTKRLALLGGRNVDGSVLVATAQAAGAFLAQATPGTSNRLAGENAQNNTKTDVVIFETVLPDDYVAGVDFNLTINANTTGAGTAGTKTLAAAAYKVADVATHSATLIATAAQAMTGAAADYVFVVTGATLSPGDRLMLKITTVTQETANVSPISSQLNSVRIA